MTVPCSTLSEDH
ncbi:hypothetical protein F383_38537 [Gossypium arboreum]|uniref:Uncharacterized protein n=1 Tax=Gossypium arboreum TaxID=29729 RepID=A0A0B0MBK2_GOSAR|nr:hypothetical protein F383_38537 [Gossypium arboreum]